MHFSTGDYSNQCNFNIAKTYNFDLSPYYNAGLIKSLTIVYSADDHGYVSINGTTYIRTYGQDYDAHYATVPKNKYKTYKFNYPLGWRVLVISSMQLWQSNWGTGDNYY